MGVGPILWVQGLHVSVLDIQCLYRTFCAYVIAFNLVVLGTPACANEWVSDFVPSLGVLFLHLVCLL